MSNSNNNEDKHSQSACWQGPWQALGLGSVQLGVYGTGLSANWVGIGAQSTLVAARRYSRKFRQLTRQYCCFIRFSYCAFRLISWRTLIEEIVTGTIQSILQLGASIVLMRLGAAKRHAAPQVPLQALG
jgi:hypothetical protein